MVSKTTESALHDGKGAIINGKSGVIIKLHEGVQYPKDDPSVFGKIFFKLLPTHRGGRPLKCTASQSLPTHQPQLLIFSC